MNEYTAMDLGKRQEIVGKIKKILEKKKDVVFAFVFGSFLNSPSFRDIDIGIYLKVPIKEKISDDELEFSKEIADKCNIPIDFIDVRVLNFAPSSFLSNIFNAGKLLFSREYKLLTDLIENTSLDSISNEYIVHQSLKELVPS